MGQDEVRKAFQQLPGPNPGDEQGSLSVKGRWHLQAVWESRRRRALGCLTDGFAVLVPQRRQLPHAIARFCTCTQLPGFYTSYPSLFRPAPPRSAVQPAHAQQQLQQQVKMSAKAKFCVSHTIWSVSSETLFAGSCDAAGMLAANVRAASWRVLRNQK